MKENILLHYRDLKNEADDVARRIALLKRIPHELSEWEPYQRLMTEYGRLYRAIWEEQMDIERRIAHLEPVERMIIRLRYFDGLEWEAIFPRIHYSQRQTFRIHKGILDKLHKD